MAGSMYRNKLTLHFAILFQSSPIVTTRVRPSGPAPFYNFRGSFSSKGGQEREHSEASQEVQNTNINRNKEEKEKDR